ncbi:hypothetical protein BCD67_10405 [Oscillatoriales cyanobacterium USR001]|nr:hypothetical protein BCD67_10405 [Oscillatoriales cyanobacterium USR001]
MLEAVAAKVDLIEDLAQRREILACTSILAGLLHQPSVIRQLFREDIMEESLFYQEIIQKGEQRGLQKGLQLGQQQQTLSLTLRLLMRRVGALTPAIEERIRALSFTQLEMLSEALLDFSTQSDLIDWLNNIN